MTDHEKLTHLDPATRRLAEQVLDQPEPQGIAGLDFMQYADLAAAVEWDVDATVPIMAEAYGIEDFAAREILLGARSEKLGRELEDEG